MSEEKDQLPLDARLLSEAIIELNITRHNVAIYPEGHPAVQRSLTRVHEHLEKLFELRPEITLAVAKDTLIVDTFFLDRKHPVYREFALHLSRLNIASVTFERGMTREELLQLKRLLVSGQPLRSEAEVAGLLRENGVTHIRLGLIDYGAFALTEGGEAASADAGPPLWERYVHGLLSGTLATDEAGDAIREIPPERLAELLNGSGAEQLPEESYDRVISSYVRRSSDRSFTSADLQRILDCIQGLRPELKKQFLSSGVRYVAKDLTLAERTLAEVPAERIVALLNAINDQQLLVPEALRNLLTKLSQLEEAEFPDRTYEGNVLADDFFLSPDVAELLGSGSFSTFVTDSYHREIQRLLTFDVARFAREESAQIRSACDAERVEAEFSALLGELVCSDVIPEDDYLSFTSLMAQEAEVLLDTGRYDQVLRSVQLLEANHREGRYPEITAHALGRYHAPEFLAKFVDSLKLFGRVQREESLALCAYFGDQLVPGLLEALVAEKSQSVRRYLIGAVSQYGPLAVPEVLKRLDDPRWFVQRNMIYILGECATPEALAAVRPFARNENLRVRFEAIRCLLKGGDETGLPALLEQLRGGTREAVEQAVALSGAFKVREAVPILLATLRKKSVSGADLLEKVPAVRALGDIADAQALPALRELAGGKSLLFKTAHEKLKEEIYLTLKKYPAAAAQALLEEGARSRNERVRDESRRLLRARRD